MWADVEGIIKWLQKKKCHGRQNKRCKKAGTDTSRTKVLLQWSYSGAVSPFGICRDADAAALSEKILHILENHSLGFKKSQEESKWKQSVPFTSIQHRQLQNSTNNQKPLSSKLNKHCLLATVGQTESDCDKLTFWTSFC